MGIHSRTLHSSAKKWTSWWVGEDTTVGEASILNWFQNWISETKQKKRHDAVQRGKFRKQYKYFLNTTTTDSFHETHESTFNSAMMATSFLTHQDHHFYHAKMNKMSTNQSSYINSKDHTINVTWLIGIHFIVFSMIKMVVLMGGKWSGNHSWIRVWVTSIVEGISCGSV